MVVGWSFRLSNDWLLEGISQAFDAQSLRSLVLFDRSCSVRSGGRRWLIHFQVDQLDFRGGILSCFNLFCHFLELSFFLIYVLTTTLVVYDRKLNSWADGEEGWFVANFRHVKEKFADSRFIRNFVVNEPILFSNKSITNLS